MAHFVPKQHVGKKRKSVDGKRYEIFAMADSYKKLKEKGPRELGSIRSLKDEFHEKSITNYDEGDISVIFIYPNEKNLDQWIVYSAYIGYNSEPIREYFKEGTIFNDSDFRWLSYYSPKYI